MGSEIYQGNKNSAVHFGLSGEVNPPVGSGEKSDVLLQLKTVARRTMHKRHTSVCRVNSERKSGESIFLFYISAILF